MNPAEAPTNEIEWSSDGTWTEEDQAGLQRLQLNRSFKVVDFHDAEDLTHDRVQLIKRGRPTDAR